MKSSLRLLHLCFSALSLFFLLSGCSASDQAYLQTQAAALQKTAASEGGKIFQTQAAGLKTTAESAIATQAVALKLTAESSVATQLAAAGTAVGTLVSRYQRQFPVTAGLDSILAGAYFYPWYGPGKIHWQDGVAGEPSLGQYTSSDPAVINQQIDWASGHGIDFFAVSWWGPSSSEDRTLREAFLRSPLARDIRFAILYETSGRLTASPNGTYDLGSAQNRQRLLDDFAYLQTTYFKNSQYLKVGGKAVVLFYLARLFSGDMATTLGLLRDAARKAGTELYLVGDEVYWQKYTPLDTRRLRLFDAVTAYNMHASEPNIAVDFTSRVRAEYTAWRAAALQAGVAFIPGTIPGFDDTAVRPAAKHPRIPRTEILFHEQVKLGLDLLDPSINLLLVNSWNEWHEDTSIEPAKAFGFKYLDILQTGLAQR